MADHHDLPLTTRLAVAGVGAVPVALIGGATLGVLSLRELAVTTLPPALTLLALLMVGRPDVRSLVFEALLVGVAATIVYDLFRWSALVLGVMDRDPIPGIGSSLGLHPGWLFGYLWRFIGNGGGIAIAFYAIGGSGIVAGTAHGLIVCSGLLTILAFAPHGQDMLFSLTPATVGVAVGGHVIYGATLGFLSSRIADRICPQHDAGCSPWR